MRIMDFDSPSGAPTSLVMLNTYSRSIGLSETTNALFNSNCSAEATLPWGFCDLVGEVEDAVGGLAVDTDVVDVIDDVDHEDVDDDDSAAVVVDTTSTS